MAEEKATARLLVCLRRKPLEKPEKTSILPKPGKNARFCGWTGEMCCAREKYPVKGSANLHETFTASVAKH